MIHRLLGTMTQLDRPKTGGRYEGFPTVLCVLAAKSLPPRREQQRTSWPHRAAASSLLLQPQRKRRAASEGASTAEPAAGNLEIKFVGSRPASTIARRGRDCARSETVRGLTGSADQRVRPAPHRFRTKPVPMCWCWNCWTSSSHEAVLPGDALPHAAAEQWLQRDEQFRDEQG